MWIEKGGRFWENAGLSRIGLSKVRRISTSVPQNDPGIEAVEGYDVYESGLQRDVFIKRSPSWKEDMFSEKLRKHNITYGKVWPESEVAFPDFFKESTRTWWSDTIMEYHKKLPFDGLWIDMNEPANFGTNEDKPTYCENKTECWSLKCPESAYEDPPYNPEQFLQENPILHVSSLWLFLKQLDMNEPANFGTNEDKPTYCENKTECWSLKCPESAYEDPPYNPEQFLQENPILHVSSLWLFLKQLDMNEPANFGTNEDKPTYCENKTECWSLKCPESAYEDPPYNPEQFLQENPILHVSSLWLFLKQLDMNEPANFGTNEDKPTYCENKTECWSLKCPESAYEDPPYNPEQFLQENPILHVSSLWLFLKQLDMNEPANFGTNEDKPTYCENKTECWSLKCPESAYEDPPYNPVSNLGKDRLSVKTLCMESVQSDGQKEYRHYDVHSLYGLLQSEPTSKVQRLTLPNRGTFTPHRPARGLLIFSLRNSNPPPISRRISPTFYTAGHRKCNTKKDKR
ncbi:maltase-glucoamylase, intestinal [Trichonephila clavipes]|nr:maltase-glucoamylase, intestinal [Trichonephila clavipes]